MQNIFAHTEPTPEGGYPAFLSINRDNKGIHTITVRSRGNGGRDTATIEVFEAVLAKLAVTLMDPRKRLGYGGYVGLQDNSAASERGRTGMDFGTALLTLKNNGKVYRDGWNGKGLWLEMQVPDAHSKMTMPYLYLNYPSGGRVPWAPSQTDVLAEDWQRKE